MHYNHHPRTTHHTPSCLFHPGRLSGNLTGKCCINVLLDWIWPWFLGFGSLRLLSWIQVKEWSGLTWGKVWSIWYSLNSCFSSSFLQLTPEGFSFPLSINVVTWFHVNIAVNIAGRNVSYMVWKSPTCIKIRFTVFWFHCNTVLWLLRKKNLCYFIQQSINCHKWIRIKDIAALI